MNHTALIGFIKSFLGQGRILTIPVPLIRLMDGEPEAALFLSQLVFWSDKSTERDGWFYKSYADWSREIYLSEYKIRKFSKLLVARGVLETKVKKAEGTPTVFYRVDMEKLFMWIGEEYWEDTMPEREPEYIQENGKMIPWGPKEKQAYWDSIPAKVWQSTGQGDKKIWEEAVKFSSAYGIHSAPDWCKWISLVVYKQTGFEPPKKKKGVGTWIADCQRLWDAAGQSEDVLIAGLEDGEKARKENGLTMSGPRSYINFCKNVAAKKRKGGETSGQTTQGQLIRTDGKRTIVEIE